MSFISSQLPKFYFSFFFFSRKSHQRLERNVCTPTCDVTWREQWRFVWKIIESNWLPMDIDELWMWSISMKNKENDGKKPIFSSFICSSSQFLSYLTRLSRQQQLLQMILMCGTGRRTLKCANEELGLMWPMWNDSNSVFAIFCSHSKCVAEYFPHFDGVRACVCFEAHRIDDDMHWGAWMRKRTISFNVHQNVYSYIDVRLDDIPQMCSRPLSHVLVLGCPSVFTSNSSAL